MLDLIVADVQYFQLLKLIHILNLGYLVFLQVQLAQGVTQWQQTLIYSCQLVWLYHIITTPNAICSRLTKASKFLIYDILFLPRKSERILLTPCRFYISLILLEPSSSICSYGKSKFYILMWVVVPSWFCCWGGTACAVAWDDWCFLSSLCCCKTSRAPTTKACPTNPQSSQFCCHTATTIPNLANGLDLYLWFIYPLLQE